MNPLILLQLISGGVALEEQIRGIIRSGDAPVIDGTPLTEAALDAVIAAARAKAQAGQSIADHEIATALGKV